MTRFFMPAGEGVDEVSAWKKHAFDLKTICFAPHVELAHELAETFRRCGVPTFAIDAQTPQRIYRQISALWWRDMLTMIVITPETFAHRDGLGHAAECVIDTKPTSKSMHRVMCAAMSLSKNGVYLDFAGNILRHGFPEGME